MNLTGFFKKLREVEDAILEAFPIVVSVATPDGGKAGSFAEVSRRIAAGLITQGLARLAEDAETRLFRKQQSEAKAAADRAAAAAKLQVSVVPTSELMELKAAAKTRKE